MPSVVVIRPGCTDFDEQHRIQGSLDLPLNDRGQEEVRKLVEELKDLPIDVIYAAPGEPARCTAEQIGRQLGIPVKEAKGLQNLNQGLWQGLQIEDVRRKFPRVFKQWQETPEAVCPPDGETIGDAITRIETALRKPLKRKQMFGVVASEPLATLITCVLKGCRPDLHDCLSEHGHQKLVTVVKRDCDVPAEAGAQASGNATTEAVVAHSIAATRGDGI